MNFLKHFFEHHVKWFQSEILEVKYFQAILNPTCVILALFGERLFCFDSLPIILMLSGFLLTIQVYLITLTTSTHVTQKVFCLTICLTFHLKNLTLHVLLITLNGNLKLAIFSRGAQSPSQLKPGFKKTLLILRSCSLLPRSWQATRPSFWGGN